MIDTLVLKTKQLLVKTVSSVIRDKEFGDEGYLSLSAKIEVHGNDVLHPDDCKLFDKSFRGLFYLLIEKEVEIIKIREIGINRKKWRIFSKQSVGLSSKDKNSSKIRAEKIIKHFMSNRDDPIYQTRSPNKKLSPESKQKTFFFQKGLEGFKLDSLLESKVVNI